MTTLQTSPDVTANDLGRFGPYGGTYVPETLHAAIARLTEEYERAKVDTDFQDELRNLLRDYVGRPTPLQFAQRLTEKVRHGAAASAAVSSASNLGADIWLKREDLAHTGAHKINNSLGQALLAKRMGKHRVIAETGAGQHGVATATAAAFLGLDCEIYMGSEDMRRQHPNVVRMELLGAKVVPVESGSRTLKDATNAAMRDWMETSDHTHYIIGSVVGPHPFPTIVRDFQSVIGNECLEQCVTQMGRLPEYVVACVGGGSNAAGIFYPFIQHGHAAPGGARFSVRINDPEADNEDTIKLIGVEAGGRSTSLGDHAAPLNFGSPGVLHGSLSYVLQDDDGQTSPVHSISAGLDYPGVGPEHSYWHDSKRVSYAVCTDAQALEAFHTLTRSEGIIPALESAHAVAHALELAATLPRDQIVLVNLSGRGDKDLDEVVRLTGIKK